MRIIHANTPELYLMSFDLLFIYNIVELSKVQVLVVYSSCRNTNQPDPRNTFGVNFGDQCVMNA